MSQLQAFNMDLVSQVKALEALLLQSAMIHTVLVRAERLPLPQWRLGASDRWHARYAELMELCEIVGYRLVVAEQ